MTKTSSRPSPGARKPDSRRSAHLSLAIVLAIVVMSFLPSLRGEFVWDDVQYVTTNPLIRSLAPHGLGEISSSPAVGNYHPLTILSLALDYRLGGLDPRVYHATNLLLHLLNVALVFQLVRLLSGNLRAALVAALLFGLHPLRVESVAWISGRKDLLYACFYLGSLIAYWHHVHREGWTRHYFVSLALFALSLLSKGMAVSLTLVLPLLDYLGRRRLTGRVYLEKIPYLVLSAIFGVVALRVQHHSGAVKLDVVYPLVEKVVLACYAVCLYLGKLIWPFSLSAVYPYPGFPAGQLPPSFLWFPAIVVALALVVAYSARHTRKVVFAALFFLVTLVFVLQIVPVGAAIAADRYTYLPAVGLAYLAGEGYAALRRGRILAQEPARILLHGALVVVVALLAAGTWKRCGVWRDPLTLFGDVIAKHPEFPWAYENRGLERARRGDKQGAIEDFTRGIEREPDFASFYVSRANAKADLGDREGAVRDYAQAVRLDPGSSMAHYNLGYLAAESGDWPTALDAFGAALRLDPTLVPAWANRGNVLTRLGRYDEAIRDYDAALGLAPGDAALQAARAEADLHLRAIRERPDR